MNQGGYGGGNPGGGWGPPPGGAPPGGGGYGPPPGGYGGPPPGAPPGGYGAPPGGYGPPPGAPPGMGAGPNPYQPPPGGPSVSPGRFAKTAIIGGVIGGVLSAIPLLNVLNCCFCLLNLAGAAVGISMYLKENPNEKISSGDAAVSGAISGAVAGGIAAVGNFIVSIALGAVLANLYRSLSPQVAASMNGALASRSVLSFVTYPLFFAGFGALGGLGSMQLFFKDRLRS